METKFILIRHGESLANANKIYAGHTDIDLSMLGRAQARAAAEYFKNEKISAIYSSDLKRAYNTALAHTEFHNLPVIKSEDLREVHIGEWEGKSLDEIRTRWPREFNIEWKERFGSMSPPGGESVFLAGKRMHDKLLSIARTATDEGKVIVAAHAAVIRAFWCYVQDIEPSMWAQLVPFPTNASASFVGYDGERLVPIYYSFDEYLAGKENFFYEA